jgi:hypothetical protein
VTASQPLERALTFLATEAEYLTIEARAPGDGPGYTVRLGDHGIGELPDGVGKDIPDAVLSAVRGVRKRAKETTEMADAVIEALWHEPRRKR